MSITRWGTTPDLASATAAGRPAGWWRSRGSECVERKDVLRAEGASESPATYSSDPGARRGITRPLCVLPLV